MTSRFTDTSVPAVEPDSLRVCERAYDHPDAQALVYALFDDQVKRYGYADPAEADPDIYTWPQGLFLVAYRDGLPVACGGFRTFDAESRTAEVKKMYCLPELRGLGLGRRILTLLEQRAAEAGAREIILETGVRNTGALALYTRAGYQPRERYATDYRDPEINRAFTKTLGT